MAENPVFVLFYHSSYQPQFYPAANGDNSSRNGEYVAIGEEWISDEAMANLDIVAHTKRDGKVFLEPTVSYVRPMPSCLASMLSYTNETLASTKSMLQELVQAATISRGHQHHRKYARVFNQSIEAFRAAVEPTVNVPGSSYTETLVNRLDLSQMSNRGDSNNGQESPAIPTAEGNQILSNEGASRASQKASNIEATVKSSHREAKGPLASPTDSARPYKSDDKLSTRLSSGRRSRERRPKPVIDIPEQQSRSPRDPASVSRDHVDKDWPENRHKSRRSSRRYHEDLQEPYREHRRSGSGAGGILSFISRRRNTST
jgi:hypothetical protein